MRAIYISIVITIGWAVGAHHRYVALHVLCQAPSNCAHAEIIFMKLRLQNKLHLPYGVAQLPKAICRPDSATAPLLALFCTVLMLVYLLNSALLHMR
jgi:hypothetical protein